MSSSVIFIAFECVIGLTAALLATFYIPLSDKLSMEGSIFLSFLAGFISMFIAIGIIGYFHLRAVHMLNRYSRSLLLSFAGLILFFIIYALIGIVLPDNFGILIFLLPLTGAVVGFNFRLTKSRDI